MIANLEQQIVIFKIKWIALQIFKKIEIQYFLSIVQTR